MPKISITVTDEEKEMIYKYAAADDRQVADFIRHAVRQCVRRNKKKDVSGVIIDLPDNLQNSPLARTRRG